MVADHQAEPCPWWMGYVLASPVRKLVQDPSRLFAPYVDEGMVVLEPGCGMGFFTLELARRVGDSGKVVALDLQPRMLNGLRRRADRAGLLDRIDIRQTGETRMGIEDLAAKVDFGVAFYVVHELPNRAGFFAEVCESLRSDGRFLVVEPRAHGGGDAGLEVSIELAIQAGLSVLDRPTFKRNQAVLLGKLRPS